MTDYHPEKIIESMLKGISNLYPYLSEQKYKLKLSKETYRECVKFIDECIPILDKIIDKNREQHTESLKEIIPIINKYFPPIFYLQKEDGTR